LFVALGSGQEQLFDPTFDARVARPAYPSAKRPKVLFDEGHFNVHTHGGTYKPFSDLMTNDGYRVSPNKERFSRKSLKGYDVLLIANALGGADDTPQAARPAFTDEECDAVRDWVRAGGALLLVADHNPAAAAAEGLARRFGVGMSQGLTYDESHYFRQEGAKTFLEFTRDNGLLGDHPITRGRGASEGITRVVSFAGQSLKGPPGSAALLVLSGSAMDLSFPDRKSRVSAAGRSQALAMTFGKGRVVVVGEAGMLTAQVITERTGDSSRERRLGMNTSNTDNRQWALNIMHWLSGLLK
jgi:hypothetical protein